MINANIYYIVKTVILIGFLVFFSYEDIRERKISNKFVAAMIAVGIILAAVPLSAEAFIRSFICAAVTAAAAFLTEKLSKGGLGRGDVFILAATGLYIGGVSMLAVVFMSLLALFLFSVAGLLLKKLNMKSRLPYIPFLLIGVIAGSLL